MRRPGQTRPRTATPARPAPRPQSAAPAQARGATTAQPAAGGSRAVERRATVARGPAPLRHITSDPDVVEALALTRGGAAATGSAEPPSAPQLTGATRRLNEVLRSRIDEVERPLAEAVDAAETTRAVERVRAASAASRRNVRSASRSRATPSMVGAVSVGPAVFELTALSGVSPVPHAPADDDDVPTPVSEKHRMQSEEAWSRLWRLPKHKADNIPLVAPRHRPQSASPSVAAVLRQQSHDADDTASPLRSERSDTSLGVMSAVSAHMQAKLANADESSLETFLDTAKFSSAMSKCDALRKVPALRRVFATRIDAAVADSHRQRLRDRRERLVAAAQADKELADAYALNDEPSGDNTPLRPRSATTAATSGPVALDAASLRKLDSFVSISSSAGVAAAKREQDAYFKDAVYASRLLRRRQRQQDAQVRREGLQSWRTARAIDELQKPEFQRVRRLREAEVELRENSWATFCVVALAQYEFHDRFIAELVARRDTQRVKRVSHSGVAMQQGQAIRERVRLMRATHIILKFWRRLRSQWYTKKSRAATDLIAKFLRDMGDSVRIPIAIKKKLKYVRRVQRYWRSLRVLRAARRHLCLRQIRHHLAASLEQDQYEVAKLRSMQKQHERELAAKKGLHRLAKEQSRQKMANMVDTRIDFLARRREAAAFFTDEVILAAIEPVVGQHERDFGKAAHRYGHAYHYFLVANDVMTDSSWREATTPMKGARRMQNSTMSASIRSESLRPPPIDPTAAGDVGAASVLEASVAVKPLRPHFRSLLSEDELAAVVLDCVDTVGASRKAAAEALTK